MSTKKTQAKKATKQTAKQTEADKLAKAEARLVEKHGKKIVKGSIKRGTGDYAGKLTVEINTVGLDGKPDGNTRRVATSDVHQVNHTEAVSVQMRKQRAKERRAAKRAEREAQASK